MYLNYKIQVPLPSPRPAFRTEEHTIKPAHIICSIPLSFRDLSPAAALQMIYDRHTSRSIQGIPLDP